MNLICNVKQLMIEQPCTNILCWIASLVLNSLVVGSSIDVKGILIDPRMCPLYQDGLASGTVPSNRPLGLASKT